MEQFKSDNSLVCSNLLAFKQRLKSLRKLDDNIQNILNIQSCSQIQENISHLHDQRHQLIQTCIHYAKNRLQEIESDPTQSGDLQNAKMELYNFSRELSVEEIIHSRTKEAIDRKCLFQTK